MQAPTDDEVRAYGTAPGVPQYRFDCWLDGRLYDDIIADSAANAAISAAQQFLDEHDKAESGKPVFELDVLVMCNDDAEPMTTSTGDSGRYVGYTISQGPGGELRACICELQDFTADIVDSVDQIDESDPTLVYVECEQLVMATHALRGMMERLEQRLRRYTAVGAMAYRIGQRVVYSPHACFSTINGQPAQAVGFVAGYVWPGVQQDAEAMLERHQLPSSDLLVGAPALDLMVVGPSGTVRVPATDVKPYRDQR